MWVPRSLRGGVELAPLPSMDVIEQVTYGDPSAGWVLMAASLATGTGGAYLGDEAVAELFGQERLPVIAGQGTRPGTRDAGGGRIPPHRIVELRVGDQARHAHPHAGRRAGHGRGAHLRAARGAGHADRQLGRAGAARHRQHRLSHRRRLRARGVHPRGDDRDAAARRRASTRSASSAWRSSATRPGRPGSAAASSTSSATKVRGGVGRTGTLAGSDAFHEQYAKAEGKYRAARAFVREVWGDVSASLDAATPLTVRQHTMIRARAGQHHLVVPRREPSSPTPPRARSRSGPAPCSACSATCTPARSTSPRRRRSSATPGVSSPAWPPGKKWLFLDLVDQA